MVHSRGERRLSWPTDFVAHMEDVLDLYAEPYDPARPVVCFDETSTQFAGRCSPAHPGEAGASEAGGLRVRKGRHPQPVS